MYTAIRYTAITLTCLSTGLLSAWLGTMTSLPNAITFGALLSMGFASIGYDIVTFAIASREAK